MLRVLPWITDGATEFIDNFIYQRKESQDNVRVFEFGCGNSTLYFLAQGCVVRSVEHDHEWANKITQTADIFGYADNLQLICKERPYHEIYQEEDFDIIVIDGRDRMLCMQAILNKGMQHDAILVFDNSERADFIYYEFESLMDISGKDVIHFEQPQVEKNNIRLTTKSFAQDRADHRWITSIFCPRGLYTTQGKLFFRPKNRKVATVPKYQALNDLDRKLLKYLDKDNGFYIEAGANDGIKQSNSYYFAESRRWKGILIEAIPELYQKCLINRPESKVYNYALVKDKSVDSVQMHYADLMSTVDGALKDEQFTHIERGIKIQNLPTTYQVTVPAKPLTEILTTYLSETDSKSLSIDLFSLDVEGYEINVLKGLDLDKFRPTYILVECRDIDVITNYLEENQYYQLERLSHHDYLFGDGNL